MNCILKPSFVFHNGVLLNTSILVAAHPDEAVGDLLDSIVYTNDLWSEEFNRNRLEYPLDGSMPELLDPRFRRQLVNEWEREIKKLVGEASYLVHAQIEVYEHSAEVDHTGVVVAPEYFALFYAIRCFRRDGFPGFSNCKLAEKPEREGRLSDHRGVDVLSLREIIARHEALFFRVDIDV